MKRSPIFTGVIILTLIGVGLVYLRKNNNSNNQSSNTSATQSTDQTNQNQDVLIINDKQIEDQAKLEGDQNTEWKAVPYSTEDPRVKTAVEVVNQFEKAYHEHDLYKIINLFTPNTKFGENLDQAIATDALVPGSFTFTKVDVRGDSSILVTVDEKRQQDATAKNPLSVRRLIELNPASQEQYVISAYFTSNDTTPTSGFKAD